MGKTLKEVQAHIRALLSDSIIKSDGTVVGGIFPKNGSDYSLKELQHFVQGYIKIIYLDKQQYCCMVVNEEGMLQNLPINAEATKIYKEAFPDSNRVIVGDVFYCNSERIK